MQPWGARTRCLAPRSVRRKPVEKLRSLRDAVGYILLFVAVQYLCSLVASYGVLAYFDRMDPGASAE